MSKLPTSGQIRVPRRGIIALTLLIQYNRQQTKQLEGVPDEMKPSMYNPPTTGYLFSERDERGALNEYLEEHPGLGSPLKWPNQIKRIRDELVVAGLIKLTGTSSRTLLPTKAGVDFVNEIIRRYGEDPINWPVIVPVEDGVPDWVAAEEKQSEEYTD